MEMYGNCRSCVLATWAFERLLYNARFQRSTNEAISVGVLVEQVSFGDCCIRWQKSEVLAVSEEVECGNGLIQHKRNSAQKVLYFEVGVDTALDYVASEVYVDGDRSRWM